MDSKRQEQIDRLVVEINSFSEKYQLIHAVTAIEKLYKDKEQSFYSKKFADIRSRILGESDPDKRDAYFKEAQRIKEDSNKRVKIIIDYNARISDNSARTTKTNNNTFFIALPKSAETIRNEDGHFDTERLGNLRKLMAHELGHIVLHSGVWREFPKSVDEATQEEDAEYFASKLLSLRDTHSTEFVEALR